MTNLKEAMEAQEREREEMIAEIDRLKSVERGLGGLLVKRTEENQELQAKLQASEWVRKDNALRTYDGLTEENKRLRKVLSESTSGERMFKLDRENQRLREALEASKWFIQVAAQKIRPDLPVYDGLDPTFYLTLSAEGDREVVEKFKSKQSQVEEALKGVGEEK